MNKEKKVWVAPKLKVLNIKKTTQQLDDPDKFNSPSEESNGPNYRAS